LQKIQEVEVVNSESLKQDKRDMREKDFLLDEYDEALNQVENISFKNLIFVYITIVLVLVLLLPKIYISNQIYYSSKKINTLYNTYTALKEENSHLKRELESVRYQLEVLDELDELDE